MAGSAEVVSFYRTEQDHVISVKMASELFGEQSVEEQARQLITQRELLPNPEVLQQERTDNARTAIMEAVTASGHLSVIRLNGSLEDIHTQVLSRLLNGYSSLLPKPEKDRRFYELCNELYIQSVERAVVAGEMEWGTGVLEISDFILGLTDKAAAEIGYRSANRKGMVRTARLEKDQDQAGIYTRVIEQVSRSNSGAATTFPLYHSLGVYPQGSLSPDVLALKTPIVYETKNFVDGAIDFQRRLDRLAGPGILYGENGNEQHVPYDQLRAVSAEREEQITYFIDRLAKYDGKLEALQTAKVISYEQRQAQYAEQVRQILRAICVLEPNYAEDCFGLDASHHYKRAALLEAAGMHEEAMLVVAGAKDLETDILFCGVRISPEEVAKLGISTDDLGTLITEGKESWKWKKGKCQVKACTSPSPTEVGPCSVCKKCQLVFELGGDPTNAMVGLLFKPNQSTGGSPKPTEEKQQMHESSVAAQTETKSEASKVVDLSSKRADAARPVGELMIMAA